MRKRVRAVGIILIIIVIFSAVSAEALQDGERARNQHEDIVSIAYHDGYDNGYEDGYEMGYKAAEHEYGLGSAYWEETVSDSWHDGHSVGYWEGYEQCYSDVKNGTVDKTIVDQEDEKSSIFKKLDDFASQSVPPIQTSRPKSDFIGGGAASPLFSFRIQDIGYVDMEMIKCALMVFGTLAVLIGTPIIVSKIKEAKRNRK